jgi:hypothetical protein
MRLLRRWDFSHPEPARQLDFVARSAYKKSSKKWEMIMYQFKNGEFGGMEAQRAGTRPMNNSRGMFLWEMVKGFQ